MNLPQTNLPTPLSTFIGREREIDEIRQLLSTHRLVTLTGPGGSGKTRLALQVATGMRDIFAHGVWWVELAALSDESLVPQGVANALHVREVPSQSLSETLSGAVHDRRLLLVMDNCEHLVTACAQLAEVLLHSGPHVRILATSREPLGIRGEILWSVPPLSLPDRQPWHDPGSVQAALNVYEQSESVRLFVERASAVSPQFRLTAQNGGWIAEICRRLDGIPLAIELAAARVRILTVEHLAARLDDRFHLLTSGSRTAPARHQTLHATLDWSYALLSEAEQNLLRRLSVFAGGWSLDAVEEVCADEALPRSEILDTLARLVDKSLVVVQDQHGVLRYRFLETIRQFARERLMQAGEYETVRVPHQRFFLRMAEQAEPLLFAPQQAEWFERLDMENDNFRAALEWTLEKHDAEAALRWVGALWFFWFIRDHYREGQARIDQALAEPGAAMASPVRARALNASGFMAWIRGDYARARILLEEAYAIARQCEDRMEIAMSTRNLGLVSSWEGDYATAGVLLEKSVALWRELGNKPQTGWALPFLADVVLYQGDVPRAQALYEESAALMRSQEDKIVLAYPLRRMAYLAVRAGEYETAIAYCRESLALNTQVGDKRGMLACLAGFAAIYVAQGQWVEAARLFATVQAQLESIGITLYPADQMEYDSKLAYVRDQLPAHTFEAAWRKGKNISLEDAISTTREFPNTVERPASAREQFGGLTPREREVASLIALGKSNREIAETMTVGVKTIETYVTRILNKLGFDSRVQIATWAVEKELK